MTRNLKALGLALVAVFAMSAMAASGAQAAGVFTWPAGTQVLKAEQDGAAGSATAQQVFTTTSGSVQCGEVHGQAVVTGTSATSVLGENIVYQNAGKVEQCTGTFEPQIKFNGCKYNFTAGETIGATGMETTGTAHIVCPEGKQIVITAPLCQIKVNSQSALTGHIIYHTVTGTPNDVTLEATVTGITYAGSGVCTSAATGQYKGNVTIKGFNSSGVQQSIEVH